MVDAFYQAALAAGGKDNGPPGPRPHYHKDYYGAFVLDPDGHNIEACCHLRPARSARRNRAAQSLSAPACAGTSASGWQSPRFSWGAYPAAARPVVRPCRPGTPEHKQAAARLEEVSAAILGLAPAETRSPRSTSWRRSEGSPVPEIVGELTVEAKSGLALKSWWKSGGHSHAASALELGGKRLHRSGPP